MDWNFLFFMNSALLGVGLASDTENASIASPTPSKTLFIKNKKFHSIIISSKIKFKRMTTKKPDTAAACHTWSILSL